MKTQIEATPFSIIIQYPDATVHGANNLNWESVFDRILLTAINAPGAVVRVYPDKNAKGRCIKLTLETED